MAKGNPIGVRFDLDLLKIISSQSENITPQGALSIYENFFKKYIDEGLGYISGKKEILIYQLVNPIDKNVFYIGRTCADLKIRLNAHVTQLRSKSAESLNKRKLAVISEIIKAGLQPEIQLLEKFYPVDDDEYRGHHDKEIYWIVYYIKNGHPITNKISHYTLDALLPHIENPIEALPTFNKEVEKTLLQMSGFKSHDGFKTVRYTKPPEGGFDGKETDKYVVDEFGQMPTVDNSEIDKQIAELKRQAKPSAFSSEQWNRYVQKKINELNSQRK